MIYTEKIYITVEDLQYNICATRSYNIVVFNYDVFFLEVFLFFIHFIYLDVGLCVNSKLVYCFMFHFGRNVEKNT